jgi:hypothetical protein
MRNVDKLLYLVDIEPSNTVSNGSFDSEIYITLMQEQFTRRVHSPQMNHRLSAGSVDYQMLLNLLTIYKRSYIELDIKKQDIICF